MEVDAASIAEEQDGYERTPILIKKNIILFKRLDSLFKNGYTVTAVTM
jgi:hypothetical protein